MPLRAPHEHVTHANVPQSPGGRKGWVQDLKGADNDALTSLSREVEVHLRDVHMFNICICTCADSD